MTTQKDLNKDMVALLSSVTDSIQELRKAVVNINNEIRDLKFDKWTSPLKILEMIILMTV